MRISPPPALLVLVLGLALTGCGPSGPPGATVDLGSFVLDEPKEIVQEFEVENTTGRTVRILSEKHTCNCTVVSLDASPLEPGEVRTLTMKVLSPASYFDQDLTSTLLTDHPKYKAWVYQLRFTTYPRASFSPDKIDLGDRSIAADERDEPTQGEADLDLYWGEGGKQRSLTEPLQVRLPVDAEPVGEPVEEQMPGGIRRLRQRYRIGLTGEDRTLGTAVSDVYARAGPGAPARLGVTWTNQAPLDVWPVAINFGMVRLGDGPIVKRVRLESREDQTFRILAADSDTAALKVESGPGAVVPTDARKAHEIVATYDPTEAPASGVAAGRLTLQTDMPGIEAIEVHWTAFFVSRVVRSETPPEGDSR